MVILRGALQKHMWGQRDDFQINNLHICASSSGHHKPACDTFLDSNIESILESEAVMSSRRSQEVNEQIWNENTPIWWRDWRQWLLYRATVHVALYSQQPQLMHPHTQRSPVAAACCTASSAASATPPQSNPPPTTTLPS